MHDIHTKRIGLDVDGVLADFDHGVIDLAKRRGMASLFPAKTADVPYWNISEHFDDLMANEWDNPDFWMGLPAKPYTFPLDFQPAAYITARRIGGWVTHRWLQSKGFPTATVITVDSPEKKLHHARNLELDLFVDDYYPTVEMFRENGIPAVLMDAPYQKGHDIPPELPKIHSLSELRRRPELFDIDSYIQVLDAEGNFGGKYS
jgi:hypothetical protein